MAGFSGLALLFVVAALAGVANYHGPRLPDTTGMLLGGLVLALAVIGVSYVAPGWNLRDMLRDALGRLDFSRALLQGVLGYLLFAGAIRIDMAGLLERKWLVLVLALLGTALSSLIVALLMWWLAGVLGISVSLRWWLVFGTLISPTDPVSVLDLLRRIGVPNRLRVTIAGESLFNDGVGIVLFGVALGAATRGSMPGAGMVILEMLRVGCGSVAVGAASGWLALKLIRDIESPNLELLISLALASGVYSLSMRLNLSGPVAVALAGVAVGNQGVRYALSEPGRDHLFRFWSFVEELVNAVLFVIIGLQVAVVTPSETSVIAAAVAVPVCVLARAVAVTFSALPRAVWTRTRMVRGAVLLTWGGLRGAVSVALVLSLPPSSGRDLLLTCTYAVVLWTLVVQNLSLGPLARRLLSDEQSESPHDQ